MIFNLFKSDAEEKSFETPTFTEEMKKEAKEYIETILKKANFNSIVAINNDSEDLIYVMIEDENETARIIGKDGQTLLSLKTLLQSYISRKFDQPIPVFVDCNEYYSIKIEKAQNKAKDLEKKLNEDKNSIELFPMSAIERRAIHTLIKIIKQLKHTALAKATIVVLYSL